MEQMPLIELLVSLAVGAGFLLVLVGFARGWQHVYRRRRAGEAVAALPRRLGLVPWGAVDIVGLTALTVVLQSGATILLARRLRVEPTTPLTELPAETQVYFVAALALANLLWTALALAAMVLLRRATARELGWQAEHWVGDLVRGAKAFCMLAPLVYALQGILVQFWPSQHPLIEMIRQHRSPELIVLVGFAATIAAPIFEEFAFRLFLQGWLQNALLLRTVHGQSLPRLVSDKLLAGIAPIERERLNRATQLAPHASAPDGSALLDRFPDALPPTSSDAPYAASATSGALGDEQNQGEQVQSLDEPPPQADEVPAAAPPRLLLTPILISSLVFALLHFSHGPDWVPLIVLAAGLGYLYQRTQRILPCIVVHMLLNSVSFLMLLIELVIHPAPGG